MKIILNGVLSFNGCFSLSLMQINFNFCIYNVIFQHSRKNEEVHFSEVLSMMHLFS